MLKIRIIPTLLWKNVGLVKGVGFDSWRRVGPVLPAVRVYNRRDVDELVLLDIAATLEGTEPDVDTLHDYAEDCFVPLTVGGGIKSLEHVQLLLRAGADKICINSAAYKDPSLISIVAQRFGVQCIVGSIDVREHGGGYCCYSHSGTVDEKRDVVEWARELQERGAGEILITSIDRDGTMKGYDLRLIERVVGAVNIPVIVSGGAGKYEDMLAAIQCGASAVAAASMFHYTEQTPAGAKEFLAERGIPVRRNYVDVT